MTQKYSIELIEEHDAVNFYSAHLSEEELSELERFFEKFPEGCEYDEDIDTIISWLDRICEIGALERYFRYEGKFCDGVSAIRIETSNLRLYCIRLSDKILIFGNGGIKDCATWQESESLSDYVETLVDTSRFISSRPSNGTLYIVDKEIIGNLNFPAMKRSNIIEARRTKVSPEVRRRVDLSFLIVDRIHSILEEKGLKQKDLANMLGKKESEISKWMRGTHNFTIETITSIESVLGIPILQVVGA